MENLLAHTAHFLTLNFLLPKQREAQLTFQHHSLTPHPYRCVRVGSGAAQAGMCQQIPFRHSQTIAALLLLEALLHSPFFHHPFVLTSPPRAPERRRQRVLGGGPAAKPRAVLLRESPYSRSRSAFPPPTHPLTSGCTRELCRV